METPAQILIKAIVQIGEVVIATASLILYFFFGDTFLPTITEVKRDNIDTYAVMPQEVSLDEDAVAALHTLGFTMAKSKEIVRLLLIEYGPLSTSDIIKKALSSY